MIDTVSETSGTNASEAEMPPAAVVVYRDGLPLYVLDATGGVFAADAPADRAAAAILLAQAAMALAGLPPVEPESNGERTLRIVRVLDGIGTPEAEAAIAALGDAAEIQTTALEMATAVLEAAAPTTH